MRLFVLVLAFVLVGAAVPLALADDLLADEQCPQQGACVGPGTCTALACVPRSCQPVAFCRSEVSSAEACATNVTIQGRTCQLVVGVGGRGSGPNSDLWAGVALTDGRVDAFNLRNTWASPTIEASGRVNGVSVGDTSVGVYQSTIFTEGPRGGPLAPISPGTEHEWTHLVLVVYHGRGVTGGDTVSAGVILLDGVPEGCYLRSSSPTLPNVDCPRPATILP